MVYLPVELSYDVTPSILRSFHPASSASDPFIPSSICQSMPSLCEALLESSTNLASMYTCLASTSSSAIIRSQASRMSRGAVTIIAFDSWNATAILVTFQFCPNSPFHISLSFSANSPAEA